MQQITTDLFRSILFFTKAIACNVKESIPGTTGWTGSWRF